jgi:hypothetical protein
MRKSNKYANFKMAFRKKSDVIDIQLKTRFRIISYWEHNLILNNLFVLMESESQSRLASSFIVYDNEVYLRRPPDYIQPMFVQPPGLHKGKNLGAFSKILFVIIAYVMITTSGLYGLFKNPILYPMIILATWNLCKFSMAIGRKVLKKLGRRKLSKT